jgi:hypothetical protein
MLHETSKLDLAHYNLPPPKISRTKSKTQLHETAQTASVSPTKHSASAYVCIEDEIESRVKETKHPALSKICVCMIRSSTGIELVFSSPHSYTLLLMQVLAKNNDYSDDRYLDACCDVLI